MIGLGLKDEALNPIFQNGHIKINSLIDALNQTWPAIAMHLNCSTNNLLQ